MSYVGDDYEKAVREHSDLREQAHHSLVDVLARAYRDATGRSASERLKEALYYAVRFE